ncbi:MAG: hypothetical protein RIR88_35 [Actinomycetota bacterium]
MSTPSTEFQGFAFYGDGHETAKQTIKVIQTGLVIGAVLAAVFGGLILAWPGATLLVIAVLLGLYFLIRGVVRLVAGIFAPGLTAGGRTLSNILGILLIAVGIFALKNPGDSLAILGILIGLSWIIDGIATLVEASRAVSRGFAIAAGIISIAAGVVVLFVPIEGVAVLTLVAGIFLIVIAVAQIVGAIALGASAKRALK